MINTVAALEPIPIVVQAPQASRGDIRRLGDFPIGASDGGTVRLGELGRFVKVSENPIIYHKDLRSVEYVVSDVGHTEGPPGGLLPTLLDLERHLRGYTSPYGLAVPGHFIKPPPEDGRSYVQWGGEWKVAYVMFRDMSIAFAVALVAIYFLLGRWFDNFRVPALIMAPIPLTLLGMVPGHWLLGAEFTATSLIGWIVLSGILVRNSVLLVDFAFRAIRAGMPAENAVIQACVTRTRPIMITALALGACSSIFLGDPVFQGMGISLAFGVMVSTLLSLVVIPMSCAAASHSP